jgi:hypothetical protein
MAKEGVPRARRLDGRLQDSDAEQHCPLCGFDEKWVPVGLRPATPTPPKPKSCLSGTAEAGSGYLHQPESSPPFQLRFPSSACQGTELVRMLPTSDTPANASLNCLERATGRHGTSFASTRQVPGQTGGSELRQDWSTLDRLWISRCERANKLCPLWAGVGDQQV